MEWKILLFFVKFCIYKLHNIWPDRTRAHVRSQHDQNRRNFDQDISIGVCRVCVCVWYTNVNLPTWYSYQMITKNSFHHIIWYICLYTGWISIWMKSKQTKIGYNFRNRLQISADGTTKATKKIAICYSIFHVFTQTKIETITSLSNCIWVDWVADDPFGSIINAYPQNYYFYFQQKNQLSQNNCASLNNWQWFLFFLSLSKKTTKTKRNGRRVKKKR